MKVLLISPKAKLAEAKTVAGFRLPQMTLAQVAALLPQDLEIQIVDEILQPAPLDTDADLVGITVMSEVVERAYQVADEYRARGVPVIMGGIHATLCPDEAKEHCDAVVIGEAEGQLAGLIADFRAGRLQPFYRRTEFADLRGLPNPRRDLLDPHGYRTLNLIQMTRGCPNNCVFCIVHKIHGRKVRTRPIAEVLAEIESLEGNHIAFSDDNLGADPIYAKEFLTRLVPLRKKFTAQTSLRVLQDDEMLNLLKKAGAVGFFIGFESVAQASLDAMKKRLDPTRFVERVKKIHDLGIFIIGSFVFGMDTDGPDIFNRTVEFVNAVGIDVPQFTLLTPFPGTEIYEQFERENRLVLPKWWLTSGWNLVPYLPKQMSRERLREEWIRAQQQVYRWPKILRRVGGQVAKRSWLAAELTLATNIAYRTITDALVRADGQAARGEGTVE
jgi:radical SAM superfamily enzyme YgiQ (UPF0313 family)